MDTTHDTHQRPEGQTDSMPSVATSAANSRKTGLLGSSVRPLILLVSEPADEHARDMAHLLRTQGGYDVTVANVETALLSAHESVRVPDLVLINAVNAVTPRPDGALSALRADARQRDVPTIDIVARRADEPQPDGDYPDDADDYLTWPSTARELLARVGTHVELARLRREASQRLALIARAANDALYDWDVRTGLAWSNDAYARQFGGHPPDVESDMRDWSARLHPDERDRVTRSLDAAVNGDAEGWSAEYHFRRSDGAYAYVLDRMHIVRDGAGRAVRMAGSMLDLTERRQTEDALRASEEKFAKAFGLSPVMLSITSLADGRLLDVNQSLLDATGYAREEVLGRTPVEMGWWVHPEQRERGLAELRERGRVVNQEIAFRMRDGRERVCLCSVEIIHINGAPCVLTALVDITQRKQAEQTLTEQARLLDLSTDAILVRDASERITYWSLGAEALYGYTRDEALGCVAFELLQVQFPRPLDEIKAALWRDGRWEGELAQVRKDGTGLTVLTRWVLDRADERAGRSASVLVINTDITARKRAEEELRRAAGLLRAVSETTSDLIYVKDRAGRLLLANPATLSVIGHPAEAVLGKNEAEWHADKVQAAQLMATDQHIMATGQPQVIEETFTGPEGTRVYLSTKSPWRDERGEVIGLIGVSHDLTNRKRNEEAIRQNEARARLAIHAAQLGTWRYDPATGVVELDERMRDIWGEPADASALPLSEAMGRIHPDDRTRVADAVAAALDPASSDTYDVDYRIARPDGAERWVSANGQAQFAGEGAARKAVTFIGTALDITERKRAEAQITGQNEVLGALAVGNPLEQILQLAIEAVERQLPGSAASVLLANEDATRLFHGASRRLPAEYNAAIDGIAIGEGAGSCGTAAFRREAVIVSDTARDPLWAPYRDLALSHNLRACWSNPILSSGGELYGTFAIYFGEPRRPQAEELAVLETTARVAGIAIERKRAEEALRESEARLQQMADAMPQVVWMADADGVVRYYNRRVLAWAGAAQTQTAQGTWDWQPFIHPDDLEPTASAWQEAARAARPYTMEHRIQMADGSYRWHLSRAYPGRDAGGRVTKWFGTATDIHDLKLAEERLATANTRFRIAENASNGFIYDLDLATGAETRSENFTRVLGYEESDVPGGREAWEALIHPDDVARIRAETDATLDPGSPGARYEYRLRHKDGRWLWVLDENAVARDAEGKPSRIIGTIIDITARKTNEERLQRLQAVTASLADAQTLSEVRRIILHEVVSALDSGAGGLRRVAGDALVLDTYELAPHFNEEELRRVAVVPLDAPHPAAEAARTGEAVFAGDARDIIRRYPGLADVVKRQGTQAIAHLPLKRGDETFGVLSLPFAEPRAWDENERAFALALADRAAVAYERARLFQVVVASEARFRELADAMPQIVWGNDAGGKVNYLNQRWLDYTGLSLDESLREANAVVHPEDRPVVEAVWTGNLAHGRPFEYELRIRRRDGAYRWHLARCVPTRDAAGQVTGWYGTSTDIHERKQAERDAQFLADLGVLFNNAGDPMALIEAATRAVGEYFGVSRCVLNEVDLAAGVARIAHDYHAGLPSLAGEYPLSDAIVEDLADYLAGRVVARGDVRTHPRTAALYEAAYAPAGVRAFLAAPLLQAGRWAATMWISDGEPRTWTASEIALLRTVAERVWLAVENTRLQAETQSLNATLEARVARRTEELRQSREQLRQISARAEQTQENERIRIAREVHDDLGGALTVLKMSLVRLRKTRVTDAALTAAIQDLIGQSDAMVQTVRRIASDLRPPMLDDLGLLVAMEWQASEFERRTGIACRFDMPPEDWRPDGKTSTAVFRVFQESLTNVARHAHATQVTTSVRREGDHIVLEVRDNGRGINPDPMRTGKSFGLLGMRERMREVAGEFDISAAPGGGTSVIIRVPLAPAQTHDPHGQAGLDAANANGQDDL